MIKKIALLLALPLICFGVALAPIQQYTAATDKWEKVGPNKWSYVMTNVPTNGQTVATPDLLGIPSGSLIRLQTLNLDYEEGSRGLATINQTPSSFPVTANLQSYFIGKLIFPASQSGSVGVGLARNEVLLRDSVVAGDTYVIKKSPLDLSAPFNLFTYQSWAGEDVSRLSVSLYGQDSSFSTDPGVSVAGGGTTAIQFLVWW